MKFINELFPNARFICIHRDPRDVVASLLKKQWAPNDVEGATNWLVNVYDRLAENKKTNPNLQLYEISLESLVQNPEEKMDEIRKFLDLEIGFDLSSIDLTKSNSGRWKKEIDSKKADILHKKLGYYIKHYGYE